MIDIHSHYLPDLDDGAGNVNESIEMLIDSFSQGVSLSVATPHCKIHNQTDIDLFLKNRESAYELLCKKLSNGQHKIPKLLMGSEIYLDNDINKYYGIEKLCIEKTNSLLIEFPIEKGFSHYAEWLYDLSFKGLKPIIAHIDRYPFWQNLIEEFRDLNVVFQINASKFLTISGRSLIRKLFKYNNKYIVSSDMHNMRNRKCNMNIAYSVANKKYKNKADILFKENAQSIFVDR